MSADVIRLPKPPNTARPAGIAGIPGSKPRATVGFLGVRRLENVNKPRDPHGPGTRLQDLCEGVTATDDVLRTRGVARGPLSARAYLGSEPAPERAHLRPAVPKPPPPDAVRSKRVYSERTGEAARGVAPPGKEWEPMGKKPRPDAWRPSAELPEFGLACRARRNDPPQLAVSRVDKLQKEANQRALFALNAADGVAPVPTCAVDLSAAGSGTLPRPKAGAVGSVYEPLRLAQDQAKEQLRDLQAKAMVARDNVRGLLGGGGGVQIGAPPPVPNIKLPQRVIDSVRPRPPYIQETSGGEAGYIMPAKVSSMFPVFKDGDATAPRSDYRRRLLEPTASDLRPAWH